MNSSTQPAVGTDGVTGKTMSGSGNRLVTRGVHEYLLCVWNPWHLRCGGVAASGFCPPRVLLHRKHPLVAGIIVLVFSSRAGITFFLKEQNLI